MAYQLQIVAKPTYLHAIVTGTNTAENVTGYLQALMRECEARQSFSVLIEELFATVAEAEAWLVGKLR